MIEELPISTTQVVIIIVVMGVLFAILGIYMAQQMSALLEHEKQAAKLEHSSTLIIPNRYIVYTHYV